MLNNIEERWADGKIEEEIYDKRSNKLKKEIAEISFDKKSDRFRTSHVNEVIRLTEVISTNYEEKRATSQ